MAKYNVQKADNNFDHPGMEYMVLLNHKMLMCSFDDEALGGAHEGVASDT